MIKNTFYFTFKSPIVLHVEKRLDQEDKVEFKIYDATIWETNNYNRHIAQ